MRRLFVATAAMTGALAVAVIAGATQPKTGGWRSSARPPGVSFNTSAATRHRPAEVYSFVYLTGCPGPQGGAVFWTHIVSVSRRGTFSFGGQGIPSVGHSFPFGGSGRFISSTRARVKVTVHKKGCGNGTKRFLVKRFRSRPSG